MECVSERPQGGRSAAECGSPAGHSTGRPGGAEAAHSRARHRDLNQEPGREQTGETSRRQSPEKPRRDSRQSTDKPQRRPSRSPEKSRRDSRQSQDKYRKDSRQSPEKFRRDSRQSSQKELRESPPTNNADPAKSMAGVMMFKKRVLRWKAARLRGGQEDPKQPSRYENSFQMTPAAEQRFSTQAVRDVISQVQRYYLGSQSQYSGAKAAQLSRIMAEDVKGRVKALGYWRYKLVVMVTFGESRSQGLQVSSRCMWDTGTDSEASVTYRTKDLSCVISVFAVYYE